MKCSGTGPCTKAARESSLLAFLRLAPFAASQYFVRFRTKAHSPNFDDLFTQVTRRFDLSVIRQIEPGKETLGVVLPETALFGSGRPVLVVPYIQKRE